MVTQCLLEVGKIFGDSSLDRLLLVDHETITESLFNNKNIKDCHHWGSD